MKAIAVGVLVLLSLAPPVMSQVPDDMLVVPGERIGKQTLEVTIDDLVRMNGPDYFENSDDSVDLRGEFQHRTWIHLALSAGYRRNQTRVEYLSVSSGGFYFPRGSPIPSALKAKYPDIRVNEVTSSGGTIGFIIVEAPTAIVSGYKTDKGVAIGTFHERITEAYGKPTAESTMLRLVTPPKRWIYDERGIAFRMQDLRAFEILIFRPGAARSIWNF